MLARLEICTYLCNAIKKQQYGNNKQQTAAVIAAKWRRKTLNRLNVKLHTFTGDLRNTEHYNKTCKANKRNATTKNGKRGPPLISGYKVVHHTLFPL